MTEVLKLRRASRATMENFVQPRSLARAGTVGDVGPSNVHAFLDRNRYYWLTSVNCYTQRVAGLFSETVGHRPVEVILDCSSLRNLNMDEGRSLIMYSIAQAEK